MGPDVRRTERPASSPVHAVVLAVTTPRRGEGHEGSMSETASGSWSIPPGELRRGEEPIFPIRNLAGEAAQRPTVPERRPVWQPGRHRAWACELRQCTTTGRQRIGGQPPDDRGSAPPPSPRPGDVQASAEPPAGCLRGRSTHDRGNGPARDQPTSDLVLPLSPSPSTTNSRLSPKVHRSPPIQRSYRQPG
jgi:hypothetical protein